MKHQTSNMLKKKKKIALNYLILSIQVDAYGCRRINWMIPHTEDNINLIYPTFRISIKIRTN